MKYACGVGQGKSLAFEKKLLAQKGEIGIESKRSEKARAAAPHSK